MANIPIDGERLRKLMAEHGRIEKIFLAHPELGRSTFFKAVRENKVSEAKLREWSNFLGRHIDSFRPEDGLSENNEKWYPAYDVSGDWVNIILELGDVETQPTWKKESIFINQSKTNLSGVYFDEEAQMSEDPERVGRFVMAGQIHADCVFGTYFVEGRKNARGIGSFLLRIIEDGYLEGICTYWGHNDRLACSENIMVRKNLRDFNRKLEAAKLRLIKNKYYFEL